MSFIPFLRYRHINVESGKSFAALLYFVAGLALLYLAYSRLKALAVNGAGHPADVGCILA